MEPSNLVKVVAAFVAGVVVALGSALIYVRVSDMVHPHPVAQTMLPAQSPPVTDTVLPVAAHDTPAPETQPAPEIADADDAVPSVPRANSTRRKPAVPPPAHTLAPRQVDTSKYEPRHDTVDIAQSYPPTNLPTSAPPPIVSDPAPATAPQPPVLQPEAQPPMTPARQPNVVTLQPGTNLAIRLGETLSTDHNYTGDTFRGTLDSPVILDGFIIADRGSKVLGKIVNAEKAGRMEGTAGLSLALTEINTTDGQRVRVETNSILKRGPSNTGDDAAKIAGGAVLGTIIGAVAGGGKGAAIGAGAGGAAGTGAVLLTHGRPAVMPTESRLNFRLANPVTITEKLNN